MSPFLSWGRFLRGRLTVVARMRAASYKKRSGYHATWCICGLRVVPIVVTLLKDALRGGSNHEGEINVILKV